MSAPEDPKASVLRLDRRQTADALQQALELRRSGLAQSAMEATLTGVVAELLADALLTAGYVVGIETPPAGTA